MFFVRKSDQRINDIHNMLEVVKLATSICNTTIFNSHYKVKIAVIIRKQDEFKVRYMCFSKIYITNVCCVILLKLLMYLMYKKV